MSTPPMHVFGSATTTDTQRAVALIGKLMATGSGTQSSQGVLTFTTTQPKRVQPRYVQPHVQSSGEPHLEAHVETLSLHPPPSELTTRDLLATGRTKPL